MWSWLTTLTISSQELYLLYYQKISLVLLHEAYYLNALDVLKTTAPLHIKWQAATTLIEERDWVIWGITVQRALLALGPFNNLRFLSSVQYGTIGMHYVDNTQDHISPFITYACAILSCSKLITTRMVRLHNKCHTTTCMLPNCMEWCGNQSVLFVYC